MYVTDYLTISQSVMVSAPLSVGEIYGGRQEKQTVSESSSVVGLMLDSLEAAVERRLRSKLHLRQHLVSLCSYRAPSSSGSEPQGAIQSS